MVRGLIVVVVVSVVGACAYKDDSAGGDDYRDPYMDEPLPPSCRETSTGPCETEGEPTGGELIDQCAASDECPEGQQCLAEFDGDRTAFVCATACVPTADEDGWCIDDASCCDSNAQCSPRGYCLLP